MKGKDLLSMADLTPEDLERLIDKARQMKLKEMVEQRPSTGSGRLAGKTLALIFEKPSLRTRVSFDIAMWQLGGHALYLSDAEVQFGKREPVADGARVLSRYVDGIVARTFAHATVELLARYASVPVINGLSDYEHPCQALADLLTIHEKKGRIAGVSIAYIGDGNNVAASLALGAALAGAHFTIASPRGYELPPQVLEQVQSLARQSGGQLRCLEDPSQAARGADVLYTDVWVSMGQEAESSQRRTAFARYQIDARLVSLAQPDVILMHPLPAHHGEEVAPGVLDGPQSVVFDQAENRLHAQKAVLLELLGRPLRQAQGSA
ncbi:MAG: ornithine carbamoyltransferase [Chloroflexota bacterium]|nr:ornithine carbamoyltransferase [Chloroflexota bacterium]